MRLSRVAAPMLVALAWALACSHERPPPAGHEPPDVVGTAGAPGGISLNDAGPDPSGPCGEQSIPAVEDPPNLSFIIDHSASMGELLEGSDLSKYENARIALANVLRAVGHRVHYGAAIFPGVNGGNGCQPGVELVEVGPGDPPSYSVAGKTGPVLRDLLVRLQIADVEGGTPAAPTMAAMLPILSELEGRTFVVLVTDGAPNCNEELFCDAGGCGPNIEGFAGCLSQNCCEPTAQEPFANLSCVDADASIAAVRALADAGIGTFVVGMPGSEPYAQLLDAMAEAGGTAREGAIKYYPVTEAEELEASLKAIAASVSISCDLPLDYEPPDQDYVNVYFDGQLVEYDPADGWEWTEDGHVAIRGSACEQLAAGDVLEVQILAGCKTEVK